MAFAPWTQQPALPPILMGEEEDEEKRKKKVTPPPPPPPEEPSWWEKGIGRLQETGGFTMPWQAEHWENQPAWSRNIGKAALGIGLTAGGAALGGAALPAALGSASGFLPWLTGPALTAMAHPTALGLLGGLGGLTASSIMAPGGAGEPAPYEPGPYEPAMAPTPTPTPTPSVLPEPGEEWGVGPEGEPQVITVGDQQFWWNPTGGMYGTGGWDLIPARARGLTPEQQIEQARLDREAAERRTGITAGMTPEQEIEQLRIQRQWEAQQSAAQREQQMQVLQTQGGFEQQRLAEQAGFAREHQMAGAAQRMSQMYAAEPYKYWAQMGGGTPESVARLTGGEIAPGEAMGQVPLSMPSQQWWGNLMPSEQQQIMGGVNWLGIDPQDWFAMKQRMIPGMGSRQMGPTWAR